MICRCDRSFCEIWWPGWFLRIKIHQSLSSLHLSEFQNQVKFKTCFVIAHRKGRNVKFFWCQNEWWRTPVPLIPCNWWLAFSVLPPSRVGAEQVLHTMAHLMHNSSNSGLGLILLRLSLLSIVRVKARCNKFTFIWIVSDPIFMKRSLHHCNFPHPFIISANI